MLKSHQPPIRDPSLERTFKGHKDQVTALSFRPNLTQIASASLDHSVMLWNFKPNLRAYRFVGHKAPVLSVDFSPTGQLLASASRDKTVRLWTPNVKGDVTVFKAHTSAVRQVQFSRDGQQLLTCSDDKQIKIWSVHRTKYLFTYCGHLNWVRSAQFSPDAQLIVSGADDKMVKLWDLRSRTSLKTYYDHSGMVSTVAFHPTGNIIASGSNDRSINLWDIRTHKLIQHYQDAHSGNEGVNSVAFGGTGGEYLISTGGDGKVKIYDLKEGHVAFTLHAHNGPTHAATFSPAGDRFATAGADGTVLAWRSNFDPALEESTEQNENTYTTERPGTRKGESKVAVPLTSSRHGPSTGNGNARSRARSRSPGSKSPSQYESEANYGTEHSRNVSAVRDVISDPATSKRILSVGEPLFGRHSTDHNAPSPVAEHSSPISSGNIARPKSMGSPTPFTTQTASSLNSYDRQYRSASPSSSYPTEPNNYRDHADEQPIPAPRTAPLEVRQLPDQLSSTLGQIVGQLDVLTQTMHILESRLTVNEDRVAMALDQIRSFMSEKSDLTRNRPGGGGQGEETATGQWEDV